MRVEETNRIEIERRMEGMGDFMKMDYLNSCLKQSLDFDTRKFVLVKLAGIYEENRMFIEAGKLFRNAADINATVGGRLTDFIKSCELFIKGGKFEEADVSFSRALSCVSGFEVNRIKEIVKEFYKTQAKLYLANDKRRHAMETYEKLIMGFNLDMEERKFVKGQLLDLYKRLGKNKDYETLAGREDF